jgi:hypothetical protein
MALLDLLNAVMGEHMKPRNARRREIGDDPERYWDKFKDYRRLQNGRREG